MKISTFLICSFGIYLLTTQAVYCRSIATDDDRDERVLKKSLWSIFAKVHAVKQMPTEPTTTRSQDRRDNLEEMLRILRIMESGMDTEKTGFRRTVKSLRDLTTVSGTTDKNPTTGPNPGGITGGPTTGGPTTGVPTTGVPTTGVPTTGVPTTGVPTTGVPTTGVPTTGVPTTGVPTTGSNPRGIRGGATTGSNPRGIRGGATTGSNPRGIRGGASTGPNPIGANLKRVVPKFQWSDITRGIRGGPTTPLPKPTGITEATTRSHHTTATNLKRVHAPSGKYVAVYDYTAADDDEVSFREGDVIIDVTVIDDGWIEGRVQRTEEYGMIPINYVEQQ